MHPMIVAEVSRSWPPSATDRVSISRLFEEVIRVNQARGYRLHSWHQTSLVCNNVLTETIVAVFEICEFQATLKGN